MRGRSSQNIWILVLLMLAGVVLGGFIAKLVGGVSALSWLAYGNSSALPLRVSSALFWRFSFTESYNDFQGANDFALSFFSGKTILFL